jgi:hypothetical protein
MLMLALQEVQHDDVSHGERMVAIYAIPSPAMLQATSGRTPKHNGMCIAPLVVTAGREVKWPMLPVKFPEVFMGQLPVLFVLVHFGLLKPFIESNLITWNIAPTDHVSQDVVIRGDIVSQARV